MTVSKLLAATMLGLAMLVNAIPAAAASAPAYRYYVACSTSKQAPPSHTCPKSSPKAAFFKSRHADVTYKICVRYPTDAKLCASNQQADKGTLNRNTITSTMPGLHHVTWFVGGKQVGAFAFTVKS